MDASDYNQLVQLLQEQQAQLNALKAEQQAYQAQAEAYQAQAAAYQAQATEQISALQQQLQAALLTQQPSPSRGQGTRPEHLVKHFQTAPKWDQNKNSKDKPENWLKSINSLWSLLSSRGARRTALASDAT